MRGATRRLPSPHLPLWRPPCLLLSLPRAAAAASLGTHGRVGDAASTLTPMRGRTFSSASAAAPSRDGQPGPSDDGGAELVQQQQPGGRSQRRRRRRQPEYDGGPIKEEAVRALPGGWADVRDAIVRKAESLGFARARVTTPEPATRLAQYKAWLAEDKHGEMGYLARPDRVARREDLSLILPGVRAVVCTLTLYWPGKKGFPLPFAPAVDPKEAATAEPGGEASHARDHGIISCYSWGQDYHDVIGPRLASLTEWTHATYGGVGRWYVDTGPLMERDLAERAGLGFVGKNTLLINEQLGSGAFLAELLTTLPLPPHPPRKKSGGCGSCKRCVTACPTGAIAADGYSIDARRCVSYLTIENKGSIPEELRPLMGNLIYGCDICQQVCPWNRWSWPGNEPRTFLTTGPPREAVATPRLEELLALRTDEAFLARFQGSPIKRIGRARLLRNVAVAMGNSGAAARFLPELRRALAEETDPLVREHVEWAVARLTSNHHHEQQQQELLQTTQPE